MDFLTVEIITAACGAIVVVTGCYALNRAAVRFDTLTTEKENKYRKVDMLNLATPGLVLMGIGLAMITLPLIFEYTVKKATLEVEIARYKVAFEQKNCSCQSNSADKKGNVHVDVSVQDVK
jgi:cytochrome c biogenesis factor